jgi:hypothetical protein
VFTPVPTTRYTHWKQKGHSLALAWLHSKVKQKKRLAIAYSQKLVVEGATKTFRLLLAYRHDE